ncbi:CRTAC1 family protein [Thalassoroseus pseudoceratinae]|uniref:CRTAC1 family protein n=1 Tax=Thalassoroseus pseudoceratinae TaxID=2713176 RepID=UPI0014235CE8|nr:CRTAC1 family protein [Thalassoroseus pseudoceratinae]
MSTDPHRDGNDDAVIETAFQQSIIVVAVVATFAVLGGGLYWWLSRPVEETVEAAPPELPEIRTAPTVDLPSIPFVDITTEADINFVHENGAAGEKLLPETMGGGCGFFDYDNDGDVDLLLVNSQRWTDSSNTQSVATQKLYANDGHGRFTDITQSAGLDISLYGMGCAIGDYDNDGDADLYLTAVGPNHLLRNDDGVFVDVSDEMKVAGDDDSYSSSAGWCDFDNDGDLDLFICNYVVWSRAYDLSQNFQLTGGGRAYGRPQDFAGVFPYLYRNDGRHFTDITETSGLQIRNPATDAAMAKSLGVTFADFDSDGLMDIFVANDTVQNFLFHNIGGNAFEEIGGISGVAFDIDGRARGAMGVDVARLRSNADWALAVGNFANEMTALYVSPANQMTFSDEAVSNGLGPQTRLDLTFGTLFADLDLDGRLDLLSANGHLEEDIHRVQPSQHYAQPPKLFWNAGADHATEFVPLGRSELGSDFIAPMVGRGASYADIDNDGDLDVLLTASGRACRLLRNDLDKSGKHWVRFRLVGTQSNRDAIGARIVLTVDGQQQFQTVMPTRSYLSQVERTITFGVGESEMIDKIEIQWPSGNQTVQQGLSVDQLYEIREDDSN